MKLASFFITFYLFTASSVHALGTDASSCTAPQSSLPGCGFVRLDCAGGPFEKIPVPDQKNVGICYSYASTQFLQGALNRYHHTQDTPELSALEAALDTRLSDPRQRKSTALYGGFQFEVTQHLLTRGYGCREDHRWNVSAMTDSDEQRMRRAAQIIPLSWIQQKQMERDFALYSPDALVKTLPEYMTNPDNRMTTLVIGSNRETLVFEPQICGIRTISPLTELSRSIFASQNILMANYYDQPYFEDAKKLAFKQCSDPENKIRLPPASEWKMATESDTKNFATRVHSALDQGYPAGIGLCLQVYADGRKFQDCTEKIGHDAIVVGRRTSMVHGKPTCQLLIRNWFGKECLDYSEDWACDQAKGSVWIDETTLISGTKEITTLELVNRDRREK